MLLTTPSSIRQQQPAHRRRSCRAGTENRFYSGQFRDMPAEVAVVRGWGVGAGGQRGVQQEARGYQTLVT